MCDQRTYVSCRVVLLSRGTTGDVPAGAHFTSIEANREPVPVESEFNSASFQ